MEVDGYDPTTNMGKFATKKATSGKSATRRGHEHGKFATKRGS
jgi:hypothetical protein